jgi:sugar phosphate isomerase/epimerase
MHFTLNISTHSGDKATIDNDWTNAQQFLQSEGFNGFELYPVGDYPWSIIPRGLMTGLHLRFIPILTPFWQGDRRRLLEIFGNEETITTFYGGLAPDALIAGYRQQLLIAHQLGCSYVVFHVAQSEFDHIHDWRFPWRWHETVDLCAEMLNEVFADTPFSGELLLENLWWPGSFRALDPEEIVYSLDRIDYPHSGVMLDTGHILNTNQSIETEAEGIVYLLDTVRSLGEMRRSIRGIHLTRSLSSGYVKQTQSQPPSEPGPGNFWSRYRQAIEHVRQIDQHDAFCDPEICRLFDIIDPQYVTYEFTYGSREEWQEKIRRQNRAMHRVRFDQKRSHRGFYI